MTDDVRYHLDPALYDRVYADLTADIAPHVAACVAAGGRVLEVCCGNGRLMIPTLAAGVACDGLDLDAAMLEDLRGRLAARGLRARLVHADMRDFDLPERYARVTIPFNSFLHNLTQADQLRTLRRCRAHLAPGGSLQLTTFHPALESLLAFDAGERLAKEVPDPATGGVLRVWERCATDRVEQVRRVTRRLERVAADGTAGAIAVPDFWIRYVWKPEMELLLAAAGFPRWTVAPLFPDPSGTAPRTAERPLREGEMLLWTAWPEAA